MHVTASSLLLEDSPGGGGGGAAYDDVTLGRVARGDGGRAGALLVRGQGTSAEEGGDVVLWAGRGSARAGRVISLARRLEIRPPAAGVVPELSFAMSTSGTESFRVQVREVVSLSFSFGSP